MPLDETFTPFLATDNNVPEEQDRLRTYLIDTFSRITYAVNPKKIGLYATAESLNGENWQYGNTTAQVKKTRNGYQIISFVPSLVSQTISQPVPNIDGNFIMTLCFGTATKPKTTAGTGDYFSFMSEGDSRISFTISDTSIIITAAGLSAYQGYIVQEYIKAGN